MESKTKKIVIASSIIGAIAIIAGAIILRQRRKRTQLENTILAGSPNVNNISDIQSGPLILWPLKFGSGYLSDTDSTAIKVIQMYLNRKINENNVYSLPVLNVDGRFGLLTQTALHKIAGVKEVSYTLYNQMESYLNSGSVFGNKYSTNPE
jgi:hypothetical protein